MRKSMPGNGVALAAAVTFAILGATILGTGRSAWAQTAPPQSIWGVACAGTSAGLDCRALQSLPMTNTGQASIAVHIPPETKKPAMLIPRALVGLFAGGHIAPVRRRGGEDRTFRQLR